MEGEYADANPLSLLECATVAEESLTKRLSVSVSQLESVSTPEVSFRCLTEFIYRQRFCVWEISTKKKLLMQ